MDKLQQKVLCIKSDYLFADGKWQGMLTNNLEKYYQLLLNKSEFRIREKLETDPGYKQIIPQVILKYKDKFFLHRQIKVTESRLNSLCPLALGGHVEQFDLNGVGDVIDTALTRELEEEVHIRANIFKKDFLGIFYLEDENEVNHMHIGLFYLFEIDSDEVKIKEKGLETIGWVTKQYLQEHRKELTFWSRIVIDLL